MADETTTPADPQAGETGNDTPQPQAGDPSTNPQAGEPKPQRSAEDYERMIAELRKEAANYRTKNKKYEEEEARRQEAQMTEQQKKDKQLADLQKAHEDTLRQHQEYKVTTEVKLQAAQLGFADVADASRLLDWSAITYDDDGSPNNVSDLLKELLKAKPYLAGKTAAPSPTGGGASNPARSQSTTPQALSWDIIGRMTPAEYSARSAEIRQWITQNPHRFGQKR